MNDEEFTAAFNSKPQVNDAFSQAFNIATGKQAAQVTPSPWELMAYLNTQLKKVH